MLLVLDVGNTNTVLGVYSAEEPRFTAGAGAKASASDSQLVRHWRWPPS